MSKIGGGYAGGASAARPQSTWRRAVAVVMSVVLTVSLMPLPGYAGRAYAEDGSPDIAGRPIAPSIMSYDGVVVASIGDNGYRSLQDAVNAAQDGDTIILKSPNSDSVLVSRKVSFSIQGSFTGEVKAASGDCTITEADGDGVKTYTATLISKYFGNESGLTNQQKAEAAKAWTMKDWEKAQSGVYIAGHGVTASGNYDNAGYPDGDGPISVDLANHAITLNNAEISVASLPVKLYSEVMGKNKACFAPGHPTNDANCSANSGYAIYNDKPYEGVVCIEDMTYLTAGTSHAAYHSGSSVYFCWGYNKGSGKMATAGIAVLDDSEWTVTLTENNAITVNAGYTYPTSTGNYPNLTMAGDAYGIYAKGNLSIVGSGSLTANVTNTGVSSYDNLINPGSAGIFANGNLSLNAGTINATTDGVEGFQVQGLGASVTTNKYGAIYAAQNLAISGGTVNATNKMSINSSFYGAVGYAIGSTSGNITISGGTVNAVQTLDGRAGIGGSAIGCGMGWLGRKGSVSITGGTVSATTDRNGMAAGAGIYGYDGITISGESTRVTVDAGSVGLAAEGGPYKITDADVKVTVPKEFPEALQGSTSLDTPLALHPVTNSSYSNAGSSINTGYYSTEVASFAVAEGYYQLEEELDSRTYYHITKQLPASWTAICGDKVYTDENGPADALAACEAGGSVYMNLDCGAVKNGLGEGESITVYMLQGKSFTGSFSTEGLKVVETVAAPSTFCGEAYTAHVFTMEVNPDEAVVKVVHDDGSADYYAALMSKPLRGYSFALKNLRSGDKVVLLRDYTTNESLASYNSAAPCPWTFDLNGKTFTYSGLAFSRNTFDLTITDSSEAQTGTLVQTGNNPVARANGGTLTINGGTFVGGSGGSVVCGISTASGATVLIHNGKFNGALKSLNGENYIFTIDGGFFTDNPAKTESGGKNYVAEGYAVRYTEGKELPYEVVKREVLTAGTYYSDQEIAATDLARDCYLVSSSNESGIFTTVVMQAGGANGDAVFNSDGVSVTGIEGIADSNASDSISSQMKELAEADANDAVEGTAKEVLVTLQAKAVLAHESSQEQKALIDMAHVPDSEAEAAAYDFLDLSIVETIIKYAIDGSGIATRVSTESAHITEPANVIDVPVMYDMAGKYNPTVLRYHGGTAQTFTRLYSKPTSLKDGTFFVEGSGSNAVVHIYTNRFSLYALVFHGVIENPAVTAPTPKTNLTYSGAPQALVDAGGTTGGTLMYALGDANGPTGPYVAPIPTATNAGTYHVWYKAVGDENHSDSEAGVVASSIARANISGAQVSLAATEFAYDGAAKEPSVKSVTLNGKKLATGKDYAVTYKNNVSAGVATAIITGVGNYAGSVTAAFTIREKLVTASTVAPVTATVSKTPIGSAKVELAQESYVYDGVAKEPSVKSVTLNGKTLVAGTDYTVTYKNNKKIGAATAIITGKGTYEGVATATFAIGLGSAKLSTVIHPKTRTMDVKWRKVSGATRYQLQWRETGGTWKTVTVKRAGAVVRGLDADGKYDLRMRAVSGSVKGAWSAQGHRWFVQQAGIAVASKKSGSVKASWSKTAKANVGYKVVVSYSKNGKAVAGKTVKAGKRNATVKGLVPGRKVWVQVRALCSVNGTIYTGALTHAKSVVKVAGKAVKGQSVQTSATGGSLMAATL